MTMRCDAVVSFAMKMNFIVSIALIWIAQVSQLFTSNLHTILMFSWSKYFVCTSGTNRIRLESWFECFIVLFCFEFVFFPPNFSFKIRDDKFRVLTTCYYYYFFHWKKLFDYNFIEFGNILFTAKIIALDYRTEFELSGKF